MLLSGGLAVLLIVGAPPSAHAHARLLESQPADGSVLTQPPPQCRLVFNSLVEQRFGRFTLTLPHGKTLSLKAAPRKARENRAITVPLPPLSAGRYRLHWSVVARDSHRVEGELDFTVR